jgi:hypothetical protein
MANLSNLQQAKQEAQIRAVERKERLEAWNDYLGFAVAKLSGFACLAVGVLEVIRPDLLAITLPYPGAVAGAGLALLVGPKTVNILAKILSALKS